MGGDTCLAVRGAEDGEVVADIDRIALGDGKVYDGEASFDGTAEGRLVLGRVSGGKNAKVGE